MGGESPLHSQMWANLSLQPQAPPHERAVVTLASTFPCSRQGAPAPASSPRYLVIRVSHSTCSRLGFPPPQMAITHLRGAVKPSSLAPGFIKCLEQGWKGRGSLSQLPCYLLSSGEEEVNMPARLGATAGLGAAVGLLPSAGGEILSSFTCMAN